MEEQEYKWTLEEVSGLKRDVHSLSTKVQELEARVNQEESDRASADTSLEDRIADLENA